MARDGNIGGAAALVEALLQSHKEKDGAVVLSLLPALLPALPPGWPEGSFRGLCCRGGLRVPARWRDGRLLTARIENPLERRVLIRCGGESFLRRERRIGLSLRD